MKIKCQVAAVLSLLTEVQTSRSVISHFKLILMEKLAAAAAAKSLQLYPTLCDPRDGSPPGLSVPGILQARTLEWVATASSNARKVKVKSLGRV